jgi:hypothetical protein
MDILKNDHNFLFTAFASTRRRLDNAVGQAGCCRAVDDDPQRINDPNHLELPVSSIPGMSHPWVEAEAPVTYGHPPFVDLK